MRSCGGVGARVGFAERIVRGVIALLVASFSAAMLPTQPVVAVLAAVAAAGIATMAASGTCPASWLRSRAARRHTAPPIAFDDATAIVQIDITSGRRR